MMSHCRRPWYRLVGVTPRKAIALGLVLGLVVEALVVVASFFGTNLFHGGHLNPITNLLLPGLGIAERLPRGTPGYVFAVLVTISLLQFPFYGALAGHCLVKRQLSTLAKVAIAIHALGAAIAVAAALFVNYS